MSSTVTRRAPKKNGGFSWGRYPMGLPRIAAYRLFRRDHTGALDFEGFTAQSHHPRPDVARALRAACRRLRDRVDEIDLAAMEVAA